MTADNDDLVRAVAESVADESPVEWDEIGDVDRRLEQLRHVARVGEAFRAAALAAEATRPRAAEPPDALFEWGHLRVLERLAGGSFGEVFRAWDSVLEREVALKLRHGSDGSSSGHRRFLQEARLLARVAHPNVLTVHGADDHDGRVGLWTDLVAGQTLEDRLAQEGTLAAGEAALIGLDLCRALAAVHGAGIVHGDVKASNVMRERGGRIVLMDFGAGADDSAGVRPATCGTPSSMAPEVLRGAAPGPRSDVYSLGVLLYRLVTGRLPVEATSVTELMSSHENGVRTLLSDRRPDLPRAFVEVVERALNPEPEQRFATAGAMEAALARSLRDSVERPGSVVSAPWKILAAVLGATTLVVAVVIHNSSRSSANLTRIRSIAVLPFDVDEGDDSFLGAALSTGIAIRLGRLPELRVTPGSDVIRWVSGHPDVHTVGEVLAVPAFVDGHIERSGDHLRAAIELITVGDGATVFADTFSARSDDVYELEHSVAKALARALGVPLPGVSAAALADSPPLNAAAFEAELAGGYYADKRTAAALGRSISAYESAIRLAPDHAPAHSGLAHAWVSMRLVDGSQPPPPKSWARHAAARALELGPGLAASHTAMAAVAFWQDWDWEGAEAELRRALEIAPDSADAHSQYAELLSTVGRHEEAIAAIGRALRIAPHSAAVRTLAGSVFLEAGRFNEAIAHLEEAVVLDPTYHPAYSRLAAVFEEKGLFDAAVEQWQNALTLSGSPATDAEALGRTYETFGITGVWRSRLAHLQEQARQGYASPALLAEAHAALRHRDEAIFWLERAITERDAHLLVIKEGPAFDDLRTDLRFAALRSALGVDVLPLYSDNEAAAQASSHPRLVVEATLYRDRENRSESLASGAAVRAGDRLYLALAPTAPVHVYIFNEDRRGGFYALFPLPDLDLSNPLRPRQRYRLPGPAGGIEQDWTVASAGGRETLLVVASLVPLEDLELEIERFVSLPSTPPAETAAPPPAYGGMGGLTARVPASTTGGSSRLFAIVSHLAGGVERGEIFIREFVLESAGP